MLISLLLSNQNHLSKVLDSSGVVLFLNKLDFMFDHVFYGVTADAFILSSRKFDLAVKNLVIEKFNHKTRKTSSVAE